MKKIKTNLNDLIADPNKSQENLITDFADRILAENNNSPRKQNNSEQTLLTSAPQPIYKKPYLLMKPADTLFNDENNSDIICLGEYNEKSSLNNTTNILDGLNGFYFNDKDLSLIDKNLSKSPTIPLRHTPMMMITNTYNSTAISNANNIIEELGLDEKISFVCPFCTSSFESESWYFL